MRLADFGADGSSVRAALALNQQLLLHRGDAVATERNLFGIDELGDYTPREARRPLEGLDAVFGVGVVWESGSATEPVLLVDEQFLGTQAEPGRVLSVQQFSGLAGLLGQLVPDLPRTRVIPLPEPLPHFASGAQSAGITQSGTFGAVFRESGIAGRSLITTAGHVAPFGTTVRDTAGHAGHVVWSHDPAAVAGIGAAADIALVDPAPFGISPGGVSFNGTTQSQPGGAIEVRGAQTLFGQSLTMGFVPALFVPAMAGMWGQVYFTTGGCSVPGDSGAPVVAPGSNEIIGHVVGGAVGITSYIQSIDIQLRATGCVL